MSATVMPTDSMRMNFNPSWNQQSAAPARTDRVPREPPNENDTSQEMATPVFAKNRYGREDLLALMEKDVPPPDGLENCKYISETPQTPVVLTGQTEAEQRYQNNINSSKAISSLPQNQRQMFAGSSEGQGGPPAANSWQTVGGNRNTGGTYRPPGGTNRWSGLQPGQDAGGSFNRSSRGGTTSSFGGGRGGSTQRTRAFGGGGRQRGTSINEDGGADGAGPQTPLTPVNGGPPAWGRQESRTEAVGSGGGGNAWQRPEPKTDSNPWRPVGGGASANPPEPGSATAPAKAWQREPPPAVASAPSSSANATGGDNGGGGQGFSNSGFTSSKSPSAERTFAQPQKPPEQKQPPVAVNRTASIPDAARQPPMPPQQDVARQVSQISLSSTSSPPAPPAVECQEWVYLDPRGNLQGPFTNQQMQAWFANGYFKSDLMLRRADETQFTNLGDLIRLNGAITPFITKAAGSPKRHATPNGQSPMAAASADGAGGYNSAAAAAAVATVESLAATEIDLERRLHEKQQRIEEEQRRLREKEEALAREEREREAKERLMREKEAELRHKEEELRRIAYEKQKEIEDRQRQLEEAEKRKREELLRMHEQLCSERLENQRQKEEDDRRRQEMQRLAKEEQERQRKLLEEQTRKLREEEERKIQRAYEEARRIEEQALEAQRKREEETRARQQQEKEIKDAKAAAQADKKKQQESLAEQKRQQLELKRQQKETERLLKEAEAQLSSSPPGGFERSDAWVTVAKPKKEKEKQAKPDLPPQKTLREIQEEEERLERERRDQYEQGILEAKRNQQPAQAPSGVWGGQKLSWGSQQQTVVSHIAGSAASQKASSGGSAWSTVPSAAPVPIPKAPEPKAQKAQQSKKKKPDNKASIACVPLIELEKKAPDEFEAWIIRRLRALNASIEVEVLASFLTAAEEYITTYCGDTKAAKEFHRDFLLKRHELRPRTKATEKDDLLGRAKTVTDTDVSNSTSASASGTGGSKNKKKKGKGQVVTGILGFKPASDPNRVNKGEIDTTPPVPTRKKH